MTSVTNSMSFLVREPLPHPTVESTSQQETSAGADADARRLVAAKLSPPVRSQSLTDDELLALFPNTPVGLATLPDGRKRLIFPRPGDEKRFITRF